MSRSRLGPLAIESPLGSGGPPHRYWRAIHVQQRKSLAILRFPLSFGTTPEAKQAFAQEWETLKKLRHSAIARCYGGGFEGNEAYLAYELIDGPSLSDEIEKRGRQAWQAVLDLADTISEALTYAHACGVVHGGLEPDRIRMAGLSPVLVDFRFQRATSAFRTQRAITIEDYAYRGPELLDDPTAQSIKSDLYALGGILFYALTGRHPLVADTPEQMQQLVHHEVPPPVATEVLDCPAFLSNLVEQLLEKDPDQRPYSAEAVTVALREVRRKAAEGTSIVEHVSAGFSPLKFQADSKEARELLGKAEEDLRPKAEPKPPIWERAWFLAASLLLLAAMIGWMVWPLGEDELRRRAEKLMDTDNRIKMVQAKRQYLFPLLRRFPDGAHADWAQEQIDQVEMAEAEHALSVKLRRGFKLKNESERRFAEAKEYEQFGDPSTAIDKYRSIVTLFEGTEDHRVFVNLSRRQIAELEALGVRGGEAERLIRERLDEADDLRRKGQLFAAKEIWNSIIELYGDNDGLQPLVLRAEDRLEQLKDSADP